MTNHARPRRWNVEIEGIRWLPRLIDKARMAQRGDIGTYFFGQSPVDVAMLRRLGISTEEFASIVAANEDDAAVLATLQRRGFDEPRLMRWSERLPRRHPRIIRMIDIDENYIGGRPFERLGLGISKATERFWTGLVKRIIKVP